MGLFNEEYAKKVYAGLTKRGYTVEELGDEAKFVERMGKESNRKALFDAVQRRGNANMGSWERFNGKMSEPVDNTVTESQLNKGWLEPAVEEKPKGDIPESYGQAVSGHIVNQRGTNKLTNFFNKEDIAEFGGYSRKQLAWLAEQPDSVRRRYINDDDYAKVLAKAQSPNRNDLKEQLAELGNRNKNAFSDYEEQKMQKDLKESQEKSFWRQFVENVGNMRGGAGITKDAATNYGRFTDPDYKTLQAVSALNKESNDIISAVENNKGFVAGMGNTLANIETWAPTLTGLNTTAIYNLVNKYEKGETLTANEEQLLDALALNTAVKQTYADEISNSYKAGQSVGEMPVFMLEMATNPMSGTAKSFVKGITKRAAEKGFANVAKKAAVKLAGSAVGGLGMAITTSVPNVAADTHVRMTGQPLYDTNEEGKIEYAGRYGEKGLEESVVKSVASRAITHGTEMFGAELFGQAFKGAGKWLLNKGRAGQAVLQGIENISKSKTGKAVKTFLDKTNWNGTLSELIEEIEEGTINAVVVGDQEIEDIYDPDNIATILQAVVVPGVAVNMVNITGSSVEYARAAVQARRNKKNAIEKVNSLFGEVEGNKYISDIDNAKDIEALNTILKGVVTSDMNKEQKKSILNYVVANTGNRVAEQYVNDFLGDAEKGYIAEYEKGSNNPGISVDDKLAEAEKAAKEALGLNNDESIEAFMGDRNVDEVADNEDVKAKLVDYLKVKAESDGEFDRIEQMRSERYAEADRGIDGVANKTDGKVYSTTLPDVGEVFITGGTVVLDNEGFIDKNNSAELYVKYPDGTTKQIAENDIKEKVVVRNAEDMKAERHAVVDSQIANDLAQANTFTYNDDSGNHVVQVLSDKGNGLFSVNADGNVTDMGEEMLYEISGGQFGKPAEDTQPIVADNETAPTATESTSANTQQIELPDVPDFFQMNGVNYKVIARNNDGSIDVKDSNGKKSSLPYGQDYSNIMPTNDKGEVQYSEMPAEQTLQRFAELLPDNAIRSTVIDNNVKEAEKALKRLDKMPNVGTDPVQVAQIMEKWNADKKTAQAKVDYWNEVAKRNAEISKSEIKEIYDGVTPKEVTETTPDEFIAEHLPKITPESFKRETGLSNSEQKALVGIVASADNGGVTIEQAAESILENYGDDLRGLGFNGDVQDVRNYIIDILTSGNPRSYAKKGLEMRKNESVEQQRAEIEAVANGLGFDSVEEMGVYEEQILPVMIERHKGFDEQEYFNNLAENYEYDTTRESETVGRGGELLQGEQTADNAGDTNIGEPRQGSEISSDVQGDDSHAASQGNQQQVNSSEIPNTSIVAEGEPIGQSDVVDNNNANVLQNGNNELNLQKEDESDNDQNQNNIPVGGQIPQSVPQGEYGTQAPLPGGVQETAARLRERIESAQGDSKSGLREVENRVTREFAQENGLWIENETELGVPFPSGDEHNNYIDAENQVVYKVNNRMHTPSILDLLNRIEQHNKYFPDSKYSLVGFTSVSKNGDVMPVFAQDFVPDARMASTQEIDDYMSTLSFARVGEARYSNGEVVIKDLKPRNVLVNPYGDAFVVDAEFEQENTQKSEDVKEVSEETTLAEGEVANAGPVNMETLQLSMSDEDFNALLNGGDKTAISEYLAELDGALRIDENSPFTGQDALREEYRKAVELYGKENIPAEVMQSLNERMQPYSDLSRAIYDRKYALQDKLREIESDEKVAEAERESAAKAEHKQTAFNGFLAGKTDLGASTAEKSLNKKYNFDGKVMTVAEFVEDAVGNGNVKLSAIEEPKYKGASRTAWNRMDARQQEADAKKVKESGTKTVYTVNDHDFGKTAYDYAKFLLDKKAEQEKADAKQKVKDAIEPFAKEKAAEQAPIKIEDVGEKIGGARKDIIRQYADKIKLDGKTFSTMFPKPDIDKLVEAGLPKDKVAAVKAMYDNAKREFEIAKKRRGKDKALQASLFYAMYAKNVLTGEERSIKDKIELDSPQEVLVKRNGKIASYQRFFTPTELKEWVENELGEGYSVEIANKINSGTGGLAAVVVTKNNESPANGKTSESGQPISNHKGMANASLTNVSAKVGKNTERANRLDAIISSIEEFGEMGPHEFLHEVVNAMLLSTDVSTTDSRYAKLGGGVTLRLADHYGNASNYKGRKDAITNYGLVVKISTKAFVPDNKVDYLEYVYFPDKLTKERQIEIVQGLKAFIETGRYELLPNPDKIHTSGKFGSGYSREGAGPLTDREVVMDSDPYSKALGRPRYTGKKMSDYVERQRTRMAQRVQDMAQKLNIDIEVLQSTEGLTGKKALGKGWFDPKSGKVTVVIPNHTSVGDVMETVLHEAVAHYGLRKLFGEHFDTFLDNVYNYADKSLKERIDGLTERYNGDVRVATEEYLASLAESTEFEFAHKQGWWQKIKGVFIDMLRKIGLDGFDGVTLTDNELRYILWRSYQNLANPGMFNSLSGQITDIAKQFDLKVGEYSPNTADLGKVANENIVEYETVEDEDGEYFRFGENGSANNGNVSIDDVTTTPLSFNERITNSVLENSAKHKANLILRAEALAAFRNNMRKVLQIQKDFDKATVESLLNFTKMYFKNAQLLGRVTPYEVGRIMASIKNAIGKKDITQNANKLVDILVDAHTRELADLLKKIAKTKATKINASGVEVMGQLDKFGQIAIEAYNNGAEMSLKQIEEAINEAQNDTKHPEEAAARINGLMMAREFVADIKDRMQQVYDMQRVLKETVKDVKDGSMSKEAWREFRKSAQEGIMEDKLDIIDAYHSLIYKMSTNVQSASARAKAFQKATVDHVREIQHFANSDMEGISDSAHGELPTKFNNKILRGVMSWTPTFDMMLREFGKKDVNGKGYLHEYFMNAVTEATDKEFNGRLADMLLIESKISEIFGEEMKIKDLYPYMRKDGISISFMENGQKRSVKLSQGQMLYIYMINKMSDGKMKLTKQGITDDIVAEMVAKLPQELIDFADWIQGDFLVQMREKLNKVHERMFGAPMAAIKDYIPIKVNKRSLTSREDISQENENDKLSTITGAIIKRTRNAAPIDLSVDALGVLLDHINEMEHWAAFAEFNRDVNTLVNYKRFKNQVLNSTSFRYGSGTELWKNFRETAQIASGTYKPKQSDIDKAVLNFAKGVTRSKINFRIYTAMKQFLSAPAFWSQADIEELLKCYVNPKGSCVWAMENLPGFKERWLSRSMGNEKLLPNDSDWEIWRNRFVQNATKWGMTPNAAMDALVVAQGARAVYLTKLKSLTKAGFSKEVAEKKALQLAAEAYNESQQSNQGAYLSPIQMSGTALASLFTTFKNSNFGYSRKTAQAIANLKKAGKKGEVIGFMTMKMMREGLPENEARAFAEREYKRGMYRSAADVALFGFGLNVLWQLGAMLPYLFAGDDEEKKKDMIAEALVRGSLGSLDGVPLGESVANYATAVMMRDNARFKLPKMVAVGDFENITDLLEFDRVRAAQEIINMFVSMGVGVNPSTFTDAFVALADREGWSAEELAMFTLRVINAPQSQLKQLLADKAMADYGIDATEIIKRYADYRMDKLTPGTQWLYSQEGKQKALLRYMKEFDRLLDERLDGVVENETAFKMFYDNADAETKGKLLDMRKKYLKGDGVVFVEKSDEDLAREIYYGKTEKKTVYLGASDVNDINEDLIFEQAWNDVNAIYSKYKKMPNGNAKGEFYHDNKKAIVFREVLWNFKKSIDFLKKEMQDKPHLAEIRMKAIREKRAKAMDLISKYNE